MFKFFRRSKKKNKTSDSQIFKNSKNEQLQSSIKDTINIEACARRTSDDINKTEEILKSADHIDQSSNVLVQKDRKTNDQKQAVSKQYEFKKEKSSRNEIVDQKQCQIEDVSKRSISIDRGAIKQDQQLQSEYDCSSRNLSFNPIRKGREFFNEIMAKGRNRHRNRNKNKENKNQVKDYQQMNQEQGLKQQIESEVGSDRNISDPPVKNDFHVRENFQVGYQITKSKNSTNLVMRFKEEDHHCENNDGRNENDQNSSSSNNIDPPEANGNGNTSNDEELVCAGANDEILYENRNCVGQLGENCDHHYNETKNSELGQQKMEYYKNNQDESVDYDDRDYHVQNESHTVEDFVDRERQQHPQFLINDQSNFEAEQISQLTECDRDRYFNTEMGQPISKTSATSNNFVKHTNDIKSDQNHIIIPTITVADFSDADKYNNNESEIFYDSEQLFDTENDQLEKSIDILDTSNEIKNSNTIDDEWHFVTNESDRVTIENDPDPINEHIVLDNSVNRKNCENSSTTSFSAHEKEICTPDSGLGSAGNILLIDSRTISNDSEIQLNCESNSYLRGSSTDCEENFLNSDYEIIYDNDDQDRNKTSQHILIDSISLPDVVVESTGMGTTSSISVKVEPVEENIGRDNDTTASQTTAGSDNRGNNKRDLVNQEARFSAQLEEANKEILNAQAKTSDLQTRIDVLENDLSIKSWNVDRLQAELDSAQKEDEGVRKRLRILENEKQALKQQFADNEAELNRKYEELKIEFEELQEKYERVQSLARSLQTQLACAQSDAEQCRLEKEKLEEEKDEELKALQKALETSHQEKTQLEIKWQKEFETLRTQNADKEEQLLTDCEWQMRTMHKNCKEKIEIAEKAKQEAVYRASEVEQQLEEQKDTFQHLKCCEAELRQLRGYTNEQTQSIAYMRQQLDDLKSDLETANIELENQIAEVKRIKNQCQMTLSMKDREMIQKIEEARGEVALQWESRLLTEMTRLKFEVETVHVEDRQEALNKLQEEHIEEIKALTTRYNSNEQELRDEIESLEEELEQKNIQYRELKEKTDDSLLETRLHLERADKDYQRAMNREEDKREALREEMRKEFELEKLEMEEKFQERLREAKDSFTEELINAKEDLSIKHRKQLEIQWEQLLAEKEDVLHSMESRHRIRLEEAENRIKDLAKEHHRDLKELRNNFDVERTTLESRDLQNSQEIEQLHRKCRCLTNLFEEMRMRYERRDPRPEDLQEIAELRSRCESQERDLQLLTERLRDMQMHLQEEQSGQPQLQTKRKVVRKPPSKTIPTSCDVIYEEIEERDSPPKENGVNGTTTNELIENLTTES